MIRRSPMDYKARLLDREKVGGDLLLFHVEKPEGFHFLAGQFCFITVPDMGYHDEKGLRRAFSIASSPHEKDLLFVMKTSDSALKRTIVEISPGTVVTLGPPAGSLVLPAGTGVPFVFIAGGVGIAPFRSLVLHAADQRTGHTITLFYSSQTPEETPFLEQLQQVPDRYPQFHVIVTMTRVGEKKWAGSTGRISPDMIRSGCTVWDRALYYIVGPPAMAAGMKEMLLGMNIPAVRIKMELFTGY
jgi:ferredoxin-NADP reductase